MRQQIGAVLMCACLAASCSGSKSTAPTATSTTTTTIPVTSSISGQVTVGASSVAIANAVLTCQDGPNAGKTATTDGNGRYTLSGLTIGGFTVAIAAPGYDGTSRGINLSPTATTVNFMLLPSVLFTRSGIGDSVFDMPTYLSRVRITGVPGTACQNFAVKIAGRLIVNVILGTCSIADALRHDGTYLTSGGVTEITISSRVAWMFTEVR